MSNNVDLDQIDSKMKKNLRNIHRTNYLMAKTIQNSKRQNERGCEQVENTIIATLIATIYYDAHLTAKAYFRCIMISLMPQQEKTLKRINEPVLLQKMGLNIEFLKKTMRSKNHSRCNSAIVALRG